MEAPLRAHLAFLADDLLEGRGTGQRGGALAVRYLETQAQAIGLQPVEGQSYRQPVPMIGTKTLPGSAVRFDAPVVFIGYGVTAPDERWDDYAGSDVKGKLLIMMVNDPKPTASEPKRFGGASLTWNGRWIYKYEEALRHGAAGVLLIHTTESSSYPWSVPANGMMHEKFHLAGPGNALEGWLHEDATRALFKAAGKDLDALRAQAEVRGFKAVDLGVTAHAALDSTVRKVDEFNVAGMVPGTDPKLKDHAVTYSAHWDHLGIDMDNDKPDHIWNGAISGHWRKPART